MVFKGHYSKNIPNQKQKVLNYHYNLEDYIGQHIEMLLFVVRSPYLERGWKERLFSSDQYYSIELIDELIEKQGFKRGDSRREVTLTR